MAIRRAADERTAIQNAIDILTKLTSGHSLRLVHGVSTRQMIAVRDELERVLKERGSDA